MVRCPSPNTNASTWPASLWGVWPPSTAMAIRRTTPSDSTTTRTLGPSTSGDFPWGPPASSPMSPPHPLRRWWSTTSSPRTPGRYGASRYGKGRSHQRPGAPQFVLQPGHHPDHSDPDHQLGARSRAPGDDGPHGPGRPPDGLIRASTTDHVSFFGVTPAWLRTRQVRCAETSNSTMARATAAKGSAQLQSTLEQFPHFAAWHSQHTPESLRSASIPRRGRIERRHSVDPGRVLVDGAGPPDGRCSDGLRSVNRHLQTVATAAANLVYFPSDPSGSPNGGNPRLPR